MVTSISIWRQQPVLGHLLLYFLVALPLLLLQLLLLLGVKKAQVEHFVLHSLRIQEVIESTIQEILVVLVPTLSVRLVRIIHRRREAISLIQKLIQFRLLYLVLIGLLCHEFDFNLMHLIIFLYSMLPQISHIIVNIEKRYTFLNVIMNLFGKLLICFNKLDQILCLFRQIAVSMSSIAHLLLDCFLMFGVLLLDMCKEMFEKGLIIHYQFVDDCAVDVLTWELVGVAFFYHFGHLSEVTRDGGSVLLDYQVVVANHVLQEKCVVWKILEQWFEFQTLLLLCFQIIRSFLNQFFDITIWHLAKLTKFLLCFQALCILLDILQRLLNLSISLTFRRVAFLYFLQSFSHTRLKTLSDSLLLTLHFED